MTEAALEALLNGKWYPSMVDEEPSKVTAVKTVGDNVFIVASRVDGGIELTEAGDLFAAVIFYDTMPEKE